jgi:hypothetical protein
MKFVDDCSVVLFVLTRREDGLVEDLLLVKAAIITPNHQRERRDHACDDPCRQSHAVDGDSQPPEPIRLDLRGTSEEEVCSEGGRYSQAETDCAKEGRCLAIQ